jgi:hypothetical protein
MMLILAVSRPPRHSRSPEKHFAHYLGSRVAFPSNKLLYDLQPQIWNAPAQAPLSVLRLVGVLKLRA